MILKTVKVKIENKNLITNCYIIMDENTKETIVIDPGAECDKIIEMLDILESKVKYILLTHCHADHIGAISELKDKKGGKILISRQDSIGLYKEDINLAYYVEISIPELEADSRLDDEDIIHIGNLEFKVISVVVIVLPLSSSLFSCPAKTNVVHEVYFGVTNVIVYIIPITVNIATINIILIFKCITTYNYTITFKVSCNNISSISYLYYRGNFI